MAHERLQYCDRVTFRVPPGFSDALMRAAERDFSSASEFARRAIRREMRRVGIVLRRGRNQDHARGALSQ